MPGTYQYDLEIKSNVEKLLKDMKQVQDRLDTVEGREYTIKFNIDEKKLSSVISNLEKMLDSLGKGTGDFKQFENLSKELSSIVSEVQSLSKAFGKVDDSGAKTLLSSIQSIDKSLFELSQNILNVNKNIGNMGNNTSGVVKQVENIGNAATDAVKQVDKLADAQSKLGNKTNISSSSNPAIEQQNKLQEELKETQTEIVETRSKYQSLLDVAKKQLDDDKGTNYYSGKTTEAKAFDNFTFNEQAKRSSHFDVWSKDYEELCSLMDKTEEELKSGSIGFDDAIDRMVSAYQKYDTATKIDVGGFDFLDGVENVPSVLSDTEKAVLNENKAIKESEYTLQDYINTYLELKKVKESSLSVDPKITGVTSNGRPIIKDGSDESFKAELMMKDMESKVLQIYDKDLSALADEHIKASESAKEHAKAENQVTQAIKESSSTASQDQRKDTFPKTSENLEQVAQSEQKVQQEASAIQSKWEQAEKAIQNYMNAVTKLNNLKASDKSTGKKSYEIAGQIEEIEKLKKEAYDARQVLSSMINPQNVDTDTWKRYVDVINRLDQASNGSAESVNRLKDSLKNTLNSELNSLQNSIDKYQKIITQAQTYPSDFHPSTEYNTKLAKLESANEVLKNYKASLQGVTELTKEQQNQINRLTQDCEKAATEFKNLSAAEKGTIKVGVEKAIQRINKDLAENTKYSAEAKAGLNALLEQLKSGDPSINLRKITEEIIKIENAEIAAGRAGKSLWDIFKTKSTYGFIGQMQSYLSMYVGFYGMVNGIKQVASTIRELDTAYTEMRKVSDESVQSLKNFQKESFSTADSVGTTALAMQDATATWMRLGESLDDAKESAKDATVLLNVSEFDNIDEATDSLVAMSQAYKDLDKMEIIDVLDKIGNEYSISTDQLSTALKDSAAVLKTQGNDLAESVALITAGNAITQDASKTAGETLPERYRNIFYRTYLTARAA